MESHELLLGMLALLSYFDIGIVFGNAPWIDTGGWKESGGDGSENERVGCTWSPVTPEVDTGRLETMVFFFLLLAREYANGKRRHIFMRTTRYVWRSMEG